MTFLCVTKSFAGVTSNGCMIHIHCVTHRNRALFSPILKGKNIPILSTKTPGCFTTKHPDVIV
ncbi:hypothetical protein DXB65_11380 [Bacteroides oleiciplenus]|uniref:Uncharacterized protein n=1 Tax=Bacteroides oleiciplenus TaxID=626931 RepID=A0A3E5BCA1_9BACE|nr:hypothetical protein DXB65_11380 [Bacteroides oleiciplenus]